MNGAQKAWLGVVTVVVAILLVLVVLDIMWARKTVQWGEAFKASVVAAHDSTSVRIDEIQARLNALDTGGIRSVGQDATWPPPNFPTWP